jgi:outer membrane protein OmpA-like peptidoglycan-associated protein
MINQASRMAAAFAVVILSMTSPVSAQMETPQDPAAAAELAPAAAAAADAAPADVATAEAMPAPMADTGAPPPPPPPPMDEAPDAPAAAEEPRIPFKDGSYIAPLASAVFPVSKNALSSGFGGQLMFGVRHDYYAIEAGALYDALGGSGSPNYLGGVINGLLFPFASLPNFYGIVGGGGMEVRKYPGVSNSFSMTAVSGGAGYLFPLKVGNYEFAIRAETLFRHGWRDKRLGSKGDLDAPRQFDDVLFNLGFQLPLGLSPPPPPPPEPVKVVPVVEPVDSDGDGVVDPVDQCPGTPRGTIVNEQGCPIPNCKKPLPGERISLAGCAAGDTLILRGVNFEFDKSRLTPNAKTILDGVADELQVYSDVGIEIGGHTDSRGSDEYNQKLSEARAASVMAYFVGRGVSDSRMTSVGYGESQPVADNATDEGREENRRVEIKLTSGSAVSGAAPAPEQPPMVEPADAVAPAAVASPTP